MSIKFLFFLKLLPYIPSMFLPERYRKVGCTSMKLLSTMFPRKLVSPKNIVFIWHEKHLSTPGNGKNRKKERVTGSCLGAMRDACEGRSLQLCV